MAKKPQKPQKPKKGGNFLIRVPFFGQKVGSTASNLGGGWGQFSEYTKGGEPLPMAGPNRSPRED